MPLTGVGSYPPVMQEFIAHWSNVNASLGASPLTLRGGYTLAAFTADRAAIVAAQNAVINQDNAAQTAAGNLFNLKDATRTRLIQFRKWVLGYLSGTGYANALPHPQAGTRPPFTVGESKFLDPLQQVLNLWDTIADDDTLTGIPALELAGGYAIVAFSNDLTALRAAYLSAKNAAETATLFRRQRDTLLKPAEQRIKQYRDVIPAKFDAANGFVTSLPALSPPPGATPDPVTLTAAWNAAQSKAVLN